MKKIKTVWALVNKEGSILLTTFHRPKVEQEERKLSCVLSNYGPYYIIPLKGRMEKKFEIKHKPCHSDRTDNHRFSEWININMIPESDLFRDHQQDNWYRYCYACGRKEFRVEI